MFTVIYFHVWKWNNFVNRFNLLWQHREKPKLKCTSSFSLFKKDGLRSVYRQKSFNVLHFIKNFVTFYNRNTNIHRNINLVVKFYQTSVKHSFSYDKLQLVRLHNAIVCFKRRQRWLLFIFGVLIFSIIIMTFIMIQSSRFVYWTHSCIDCCCHDVRCRRSWFSIFYGFQWLW